MKKRLSVQFTGAAGHEELGIDMGGLFKDFWTELSSLAFDVNYGLFRQVRLLPRLTMADRVALVGALSVALRVCRVHRTYRAFRALSSHETTCSVLLEV